jgi:fatty acid desaturase
MELRAEAPMLTSKELLEFSTLRPSVYWGVMTADWTFIAITIVLAHLYWTPIFVGIAILLVAGKQHALVGLLHDGAHFRVCKSKKWNDWICNAMVAYPIGAQVQLYRKNHLLHHQYTGDERDPDWIRKKDNRSWHFPMTKINLLKVFSQYLLGLGVLEMFIAVRVLSGLNTEYFKKSPVGFCIQATYYFVTLAVITYFHWWLEFATLWLVPYFLVFPIFNRLRTIAEHFGVENQHALNQTRNVVKPRFWEKYFISPHSLNFHLDHHLYPSVPFYNLKDLHQILKKSSQYKEAHNTNAYLFASDSVVNEVTDQI